MQKSRHWSGLILCQSLWFCNFFSQFIKFCLFVLFSLSSLSMYFYPLDSIASLLISSSHLSLSWTKVLKIISKTANLNHLDLSPEKYSKKHSPRIPSNLLTESQIIYPSPFIWKCPHQKKLLKREYSYFKQKNTEVSGCLLADLFFCEVCAIHSQTQDGNVCEQFFKSRFWHSVINTQTPKWGMTTITPGMAQWFCNFILAVL